MAHSFFHTKQIRHWSLILMLCCPFLLPFSCSSLFPGGTRKLFKETAAFRTSSLILAEREIPRKFLISKSLKKFLRIFTLETFNHNNNLLRVTSFVKMRYDFANCRHWKMQRNDQAHLCCQQACREAAKFFGVKWSAWLAIIRIGNHITYDPEEESTYCA